MYFSFPKQFKNSNFSSFLFKYRLKFKMQKHIHVNCGEFSELSYVYKL